MELRCLFSTSGVGLGKSTEKLKAKLGAGAAFADIEDTILKLGRTQSILSSHGVDAPVKSMKELAWYLSRPEVKILWEEAVTLCLAHLKDSQGDLKILSGHPIYFGGQRREFYSVVNPSLLNTAETKVTQVSFLIDDVYDMYLRLCSQGELFDTATDVKRYLDAVAEERKLKPSNRSAAAVAELCLQWQKNTLMRLLLWRYLGIVLSENMAYQVGAKFLLWGVKQSSSDLINWFKGSRTAYISHSISDPRRHEGQSLEWDKIVDEVNAFPELLRAQSVTTVMPTAIDERRFEFKSGAGGDMTGKLIERWPLLGGDPSELIYVPLPPPNQNPDHRNVLLPKYMDFGSDSFKPLGTKPTPKLARRLSDLMEDLSEQIDFQIASRDHLIVSHSDSMIVYRPFAGGRVGFSGGVKSEVEHWSTIAVQSNARAAFVHLDDDIVGYVKLDIKHWGDIPKALRAEIQKDIETTEGIHGGHASEISQAVLTGKPVSGGVLSTGGIEPARLDGILAKRDVYLASARSRVLWRYLVGSLDTPVNLTGVFVYSTFEEFKSDFSTVSGFLSTGAPKSNGWESRTAKLFPS